MPLAYLGKHVVKPAENDNYGSSSSIDSAVPLLNLRHNVIDLAEINDFNACFSFARAILSGTLSIAMILLAPSSWHQRAERRPIGPNPWEYVS